MGGNPVNVVSYLLLTTDTFTVSNIQNGYFNSFKLLITDTVLDRKKAFKVRKIDFFNFFFPTFTKGFFSERRKKGLNKTQ